jgi:nitrogen fixation/metabolism regulation signal transduction histidine kinase
MLDIIQQTQNQIVGFISIIVVLLIGRYFTVKHLIPFIIEDESEKTEGIKITKRITNILIVATIVCTIIYYLFFTVSNVIPKREIQSDIKNERASYFEKTSQDILDKKDTTKNK